MAATAPGYADPQKRFTRSRILWGLSSYITLCWFAWFIFELIIHSSSASLANYGDVQPLSSMTMQLFMYGTLLAAATLTAAWLADFKRTQAARTTAFFVSAFCIFAWLWELWFIIPTFRSSGDSSNVWCSGTGLTGVPSDRFCRSARGVAAISVALELGLIGVYFWCLARFIVTREPDVPLPTPGLSTSTYAANPVVNTGVPVTTTTGQNLAVPATTTGLGTAPGAVVGTATPVYPADVKFLYLTEPDDIEQMRIVNAKPNVYDSYRLRMKSLSGVNVTLAALSLAGYIIITCCYIKIARSVGIAGYTTFYTNGDQLGDPILSNNWWPLTLSLGLSLAMTSYASFRWHRGIQGAAFLITLISALQWSSFFIYAARRLAQGEDSGALSTTGDKAAQRAVVAGIGLILICEVIRSVTLFLRYQTYMPITELDHQSLRTPGYVDAPTVVVADRDRDEYKASHDSDAPVGAHTDTAAYAEQGVNVPGPAAHTNYATGPASRNRHGKGDWKPAYNLSALSGSTIIYRGLFALTLLTLLAWWVMQWVAQCSSGIFTVGAGGPTGRSPEVTFGFTEKMFILTSLLALGSLASSAYAEYHASVAAAISSLYVNTLMLCGFFLLVWPWSYQSLPNVGVLDTAGCSGSDNRWCHISRAAGIFALITAGWMGFIWLHNIGRIVARRMLIRKFDRTIHNFPSIVAALPLCGMIIWAAANIDLGTKDSTFLANFGNLQPTSIGADVASSYFASVIFLLLTGFTFATWVGSFATYQMLCWEGWGWRHLATHLNLLVASYMIPILILAGRFIHTESLSRALTALTSGVVILTAGQIFFAASILYLAHTSIYASRAPASNLQPRYQANVGQYEKTGAYSTPAKDYNKGYGADYVDPKEAAYNRDVQHERDIEMGRPATNTVSNTPVVTSSAAPAAPSITTSDYNNPNVY